MNYRDIITLEPGTRGLWITVGDVLGWIAAGSPSITPCCPPLPGHTPDAVNASDEDAVVIAMNAPGAPREFIPPFGLKQPGARVALKVYLVLTTDNEAGSAAMFIERPAPVQLAA